MTTRREHHWSNRLRRVEPPSTAAGTLGHAPAHQHRMAPITRRRPVGNCTKDELREYLMFAIELRRRVKEQLKRMGGGIDYSQVNLSFIDKQTGEETIVTCKELGSAQINPEGALAPGDLFTVGFDGAENAFSLYRIQINAVPGGHRFNVVGTRANGIKESARMPFDYLEGNAKKTSIDRDIGAYDFNIQVMSLMKGKDAADLGVAFCVGLISAVLHRSICSGLVVLGQMSIHGFLNRVEGLGDKLRVAMDAGAKRVMIPTENRRDFAELPAEVIDKLQIDFYSDPSQAAFKALAEA